MAARILVGAIRYMLLSGGEADRDLGDQRFFGDTNRRKGLMRVHSELAPDVQESTFFHELCHAADEDLTEEQAARIERLLLPALKNAGLWNSERAQELLALARENT